MKKILITMILFIGIYSTASAQCAMCRASTASNMNNKNTNSPKVGAGLNTGILYLMSIPYIVGGLGAFFYWRNKKSIKAFLNGDPA
jgi:hypothetical protein